jgi:hypothetical protein
MIGSLFIYLPSCRQVSIIPSCYFVVFVQHFTVEELELERSITKSDLRELDQFEHETFGLE